MLLDLIYETAWFFLAMMLLASVSAFFSGSEAALFSLRRQDRRAFSSGNPAQRIVARLLEDPDRLLTAVLFWNLLVNICYFALSSIVSVQLERENRSTEAGAIAVGSLLALIVFSEMLPKTLAVLQPRLVAAAVGIPLAVMVRGVAPLLPAFRWANEISRRVICPRFEPEADLELDDVQRAIQLSTSDAALAEQEQAVLRNIVGFSDIRVEEVMRPRTQFISFRPPVALEDLGGRLTPSGYLLITEPESDAIAAAIPLRSISELPEQHLEHYAERVVYIPWSASLATALEEMRRRGVEVAAVINEFGETIGILTFDDVLALIFSDSADGRTGRAVSIQEVGPDRWHVTGRTSLRRLARQLGVELPSARGATVAGLLQEVLQRFPSAGDRCQWGPFEWTVLSTTGRGPMKVELTRIEPQEAPR